MHLRVCMYVPLVNRGQEADHYSTVSWQTFSLCAHFLFPALD